MQVSRHRGCSKVPIPSASAVFAVLSTTQFTMCFEKNEVPFNHSSVLFCTILVYHRPHHPPNSYIRPLYLVPARLVLSFAAFHQGRRLEHWGQRGGSRPRLYYTGHLGCRLGRLLLCIAAAPASASCKATAASPATPAPPWPMRAIELHFRGRLARPWSHTATLCQSPERAEGPRLATQAIGRAVVARNGQAGPIAGGCASLGHGIPCPVVQFIHSLTSVAEWERRRTPRPRRGKGTMPRPSCCGRCSRLGRAGTCPFSGIVQ